ncbi:Juvenile hormone epoxide hydrolase [Papilio machaon]|uniref:Juvenile hormone epoxide hydrolase n=1 Tax=Papilio machaon TaxID=76193 RepID=A0A194R6B8_PAPMA|nr:Juvenile hormone epoxide hydrolase [Papilio machaon]
MTKENWSSTATMLYQKISGYEKANKGGHTRSIAGTHCLKRSDFKVWFVLNVNRLKLSVPNVRKRLCMTAIRFVLNVNRLKLSVPNMSKILLGFGALVVVYIAWSALSSESPKRLEIDQNEWWGPNELKGKEDTSIRPFKVQFTDEVLRRSGGHLRSIMSPIRPHSPPLRSVSKEARESAFE